MTVDDGAVLVPGRSGPLVAETADGPVSFDKSFLCAAMMIFMAKGSGRIEPEESETMLALLRHFLDIDSARALEVLRAAIEALSQPSSLGDGLAGVARALPAEEKENLVYMALRVIAADGRREAAEMAQFQAAVDAIDVAPDTVHRAFDRFFSETMPDTGAAE